MIQNLRKVAVAAGLAALAFASSANAASYTYNFKTFYDTSTVANLFDTKTLDYSVATLTISDITGGVQVSLSENNNAFPAFSKAGTYIDGLWLNGTWGATSILGTVNSTTSTVSGVTASGSPTYLGLASIFKDGGYVYNGSITFAGVGIAEGGSSVFTIKGTGVTAANFAKSSNVPLIELTNVGSPYNGLVSILPGKVSFIGSLPAVPEPSTYVLMGLGLAGLGLASRRARRTTV